MSGYIFATAATAIIIVFSTRLLYLIYETVKNKRVTYERRCQEPVKTMIVIGSGGHTAEMLKMIQGIDYNKYRPRIYAMASNDITSEMRIISHEYAIDQDNGDYVVMKIPRSRNVGQSYLTSVLTTVYSIFLCIPQMIYYNPKLILCNGPGTCIPICLIAFLMRVLYFSENKIIFIESICRVKTLSLTGHILLFFADVIYVQWPELKNKYPRVVYIGNLV